MATATSLNYESLTGAAQDITVVEAAPGAARRQWLEQRAAEFAATGARIFVVSCDFSSGGPWVGVSELLSALLPELQAQRPDLLERHSMELAYALPRIRRSVKVRNPNLTDLAPLAEKTRNYAADRAFRNVHGLIDLLDTWKSATSPEAHWVILCDSYDGAATMNSCFFRELMRRRGRQLRITLFIAVGPGQSEHARESLRLPARTGILKLDLAPGPFPVISSAEAEKMANEVEARIHGDHIEMQVHLPELIKLWKLANRPEKVLHCRHFGLYLYNTQGLYQDALRYGEGLLEMVEKHAPGDELRWSVIFKLLMCYMGLQDPQSSLALAEGEAMKVVERDHLSWRGQLFYLLAMLYARYQKPRDFAKGEEYLERGLQAMDQAGLPEGEFHFQSVFNRNGLAMIRNFQGRHDEAIELCRTGLQRLDAHLGVEQHRLHRSVLLYNIAQVYSAIGAHADAIEHYSAAMAMDPNYSEYYNERGNIYLHLGRFDEALADYHKAIELSPPYFEVFTNLGQCYRRMGNMLQAVDAYSRALDLEPAQPLALLGRARAWEESGNAEAAIADYSTALLHDPSLWDAAASRGVLHYEKGNLHESLADFDCAIQLKPDQSDLYQNRALVLSDLSRHSDAINDLEMALTLNPAEEDRAEMEIRLQAAMRTARGKKIV